MRGRRGAVAGDEIAALLERQLALEQFGGGLVADGNEDAVGGNLLHGAGLDVLQPGAGDALGIVGADDIVKHRIPDDLDLGMGEEAVLQDALGAEFIAAVDHA